MLVELADIDVTRRLSKSQCDYSEYTLPDQFIRYTCWQMQGFQQPMTWQQPSAFSYVDMSKTTPLSAT